MNEITNVPPNSHKYKEEQKQKEKIEKVVNGNVITKKKSTSKKFADVFLSEDLKSIKDYLIYDVAVPAIKNLIVDTLTQTTEMLFYGKTRPKKTSYGSTPTYVSYGSYSRQSEVPRPGQRSRIAHNFDDLIFESRGEAEDVIDVLRDYLDRYKQVSVADLYDAVGVTGNGFTDNKYGWYDLRDAYVSKVREGYLLNMPRCVELD